MKLWKMVKRFFSHGDPFIGGSECAAITLGIITSSIYRAGEYTPDETKAMQVAAHLGILP